MTAPLGELLMLLIEWWYFVFSFFTLIFDLFSNKNCREKILMHYKKEIPYSVEIDTEEFFEDETIIRIRSVIMVERETQKGIIIGHKGSALKRVGVEARKDLEKFFGKQIHLELYVKVNKDWRSNEKQLRRFGYNQMENSKSKITNPKAQIVIH